MTNAQAALLAVVSTGALFVLHYVVRAALAFEEPEDCEGWSRD